MTGLLWFRTKRYGWGWTPASWQGWLATAIYILAIAGVVDVAATHRSASGLSRGLAIGLPVVSLTALYTGVAFLKGERPRWRWGK